MDSGLRSTYTSLYEKAEPSTLPTGSVIVSTDGKHAIKLSQPEGGKSWLVFDATHGESTDFLFDGDVADWRISYVPIDSKAWALNNGLNPNPDHTVEGEIVWV